MAAEGVKFVTSCEVGKDLPFADVRSSHDAVVLCGGATKPRDLPIEGRSLHGVHFAMEFLKVNTKSLLDSKHTDGQFISAKGLDVLVIGGGDTGTDCVGTSIRHGCKSVTQIEIMPRPAESRAGNNPWPQWPFILRTDYGQEEAIALYGQDPRVYLTTAKKMVSDENGRVKEVHTVQVRWESDSAGRMIPVEIAGSEKVYPAQLVLLAMGFLGPDDTLLADAGVNRDGRSNVQTPACGYNTSMPGIFAAGDMRRGQSLVVWAINEGRAAAKACDTFLMGDSLLP
jgi:glutamate synthase (NADPH) small chain